VRESFFAPAAMGNSFRDSPALNLLPAAFCFLLAGCNPPPNRMSFTAPPPPAPWRAEPIGRSVEGRLLDCWTIGDGPDVTVIIATIHGDEPAGTPLVRRLAGHLANHPEDLTGRKVVIVPIANPDGLARQSRFNNHGVDLNRNYPAANYRHEGGHGPAALSEPESRALFHLLESQDPARVISIHQPVRTGAACIDYDGPAADLAAAMSAASDLPVVKLGGRPGSLGSFIGDTLDRQIITVELPAEASKWDENRLWSSYGEMLLAAITFGPAQHEN
jgi:protein MpaA